MKYNLLKKTTFLFYCIYRLFEIYILKKYKKLDEKHLTNQTRVYAHVLEKKRIEGRVGPIIIYYLFTLPYFKEAEKRKVLSKSELMWVKRILFGTVKQNTPHMPEGSFRKTLKTRRSIRKFTGETVTLKKMKALVESAVWAPSSCNRQPLKFKIIRKKKSLDMIAGNKEKFISTAAAGLLVLCNRNVYSPLEVQYTSYLDAGMAIQNILLAAHSMGLGSCYVNLGKNEITPGQSGKILKYFDITDNYILIGFIALGYPAYIPPMPGRRELNEFII